MPEGRPQPGHTEQKPHIRSHAEHWVQKRGLEPERGRPHEDATPFAQQAYDLFWEKMTLQRGLVATDRMRMRDESERDGEQTALLSVRELTGTQAEDHSFERRAELIRGGKAAKLLHARESTPVSVAAQSVERVREIEDKLDEILVQPGVYERYQQGYHHEMGVRNQSAEVQDLQRVSEGLQLDAFRLARGAKVSGRSLTSVEVQRIQEDQQLRGVIQERQDELMADPEVFDHVRRLELQEYKKQLKEKRYALTPSRKKYLADVERAWAEGQRVFLTGATGTGKTELIKFASNNLFNVPPEYVTGHQDMSIFELLGKTGFNIQEGDVFRPAPLVRAMRGRGGAGQPFLFDEIDRAPNQAIFGIKTVLNARPGEKGLTIQTNGGGSFDVGKDFAVAATGNIKSDKHRTATELDPAILRMFDAPMHVEYMPAHEVYDLTLATLMDERGGIPLEQADIEVTLANLCTAAAWTQDAYEGKKIVTNQVTGDILPARGGATTGKAASLKNAVLDPGRVLGMLGGWQSERAQGTTFESYLNERLKGFVNDGSLPEEDRYYLVEIFALKGFFKGHDAEEFMVNGLNQSVLEGWTGSSAQTTAA